MARQDKKRVLIVDDEPDIRQTLHKYLGRKGFETDTADNGEEALNTIRKKRPDLIILDVMMPKMDGFTLLKRLKAGSAYSEIPVIMLTKKSGPKDLDKGVSLNADFYLPKPFTLNNIMRFVKLVIAK